MPLPKERIYTIDDIYGLPDGERAELIDGQIYYMAPPNTTHQRISTFLHGTIFNYINSKNGPCEVFHAPFAVFLQAEDEKNNANYLEPDISVICDKDKLDNKGCHGAPDWTIEIVSSSSRQMDYYKKLALYQGAGVREYWIIETAREVVMVYDLANETPPTIYRFTDSVKVNIYEDFSIDFIKLSIKYYPHCSRTITGLLLFLYPSAYGQYTDVPSYSNISVPNARYFRTERSHRKPCIRAYLLIQRYQ